MLTNSFEAEAAAGSISFIGESWGVDNVPVTTSGLLLGPTATPAFASPLPLLLSQRK